MQDQIMASYTGQVRKRHFLSTFYTKTASFCQDRLGTNIEKTPKRVPFFWQFVEGVEADAAAMSDGEMVRNQNRPLAFVPSLSWRIASAQIGN